MLATIFEMIEKILGFAGASFDAQAIVKAIFDAILGLIKTRKYNYQRLTSFLKIDSFLAEQTASPLSVLSFMLTSFDIFRYKYFYT
mgnify:CR=1 FL=1